MKEREATPSFAAAPDSIPQQQLESFANEMTIAYEEKLGKLKTAIELRYANFEKGTVP